MKQTSDLEKVCWRDRQEQQYAQALKNMANTVETRNYISAATFKLRYKLIYGDAPPNDLF